MSKFNWNVGAGVRSKTPMTARDYAARLRKSMDGNVVVVSENHIRVDGVRDLNGRTHSIDVIGTVPE